MDAMLSTDFGTLGIILVTFIMVFSIVAVPLVVWKLMKQGHAEAEAEVRKSAGK